MPKEEAGTADRPPPETRQQLLVNVIVFQFKLFLDSLRDVILSPLSIVALVLGIIFGGARPMRYFNRLLAFGRRTEAWINLFGRYGSSAGNDAIDPKNANGRVPNPEPAESESAELESAELESAELESAELESAEPAPAEAPATAGANRRNGAP